MIQYDVAARSHRGCHRPTNEDSAYAGPSTVLVADGVGGARGGDVASALAATVVAGLAARWRGADPVSLLGAVVDRTTAALRDHEAAHPEHTGLATTVTALHTDGRRCALAHLGDSRASVLRGSRLVPLTTDHSWPARRNVLLRWLGAEPQAPDLGTVDLAAGDRVLLCSDGLHGLLDDRRTAELLGGGSVDDAADALLGAALAAGAPDNVTVVVADVVDEPAVAVGGRLAGAALDAHLLRTVAS